MAYAKEVEPKKKSQTLEQALKSIEKMLPDVVPDFEEAPLGILSSGSIAADAVTVCGGFPRGRVTEISGEEGSGKTTLALMCAALVQRNGGKVVYNDMERALDPEFATRIGYDFKSRSKGAYLRPGTFEETAHIVDAVIESMETDLVIVDSVSAMLPEAIYKQEVGAVELPGLRARHMSAWLPRLVRTAQAGKTAVVLINQVRDMLPMNAYAARFGPKTTTSGGRALKFYASLRLRTALTRKGSEKRTAPDPFRAGETIDVPVANEHAVTSDKNKVGAAYRVAPFWIRYDQKLDLWGIDNVQSLLDMALASGHVTKRGSHYEVGDIKVHGEADLHALMVNDRGLCLELAGQVGLDWVNYEPVRPVVA